MSTTAVIFIIGRMTKDADQKTAASSGKTYATFSLAVNKYKPGSDENEPSYYDITAFGHDADYIINKGGKGRLVTVTGKHESRKAADGRVFWNVKADNVLLLDRSNDQATTADSEVDPFAGPD